MILNENLQFLIRKFERCINMGFETENLYERILRLCKENGTTIPNLETSLGMGKGSIYRWRSSVPSIKAVSNVADYFGVTTDYLWNGNIDSDDGVSQVLCRFRKEGSQQSNETINKIILAFINNDKNK